MELRTVEDRLKPIQQELVDYYCDINLSTMCRVCLEKNQPNKKMCNIFEAAKPMHICNMIMSCASVQVRSTSLTKKHSFTSALLDNGR